MFFVSTICRSSSGSFKPGQDRRKGGKGVLWNTFFKGQKVFGWIRTSSTTHIMFRKLNFPRLLFSQIRLKRLYCCARGRTCSKTPGIVFFLPGLSLLKTTDGCERERRLIKSIRYKRDEKCYNNNKNYNNNNTKPGKRIGSLASSLLNRRRFGQTSGAPPDTIENNYKVSRGETHTIFRKDV